ncbi:MAG TPA: hypothetical protein VGO68_14255 [Pyrinomonadaceae bacterium]|jgi:hypothetical protein|nr:hypothetical protein [Pyrinomonadaceae bacterium]
MLTSTTPPDAFEELPARSSLPWVWFGFLFVVAFVAEETLLFVLDLDSGVATVVLVVIALAGWIYWLLCVSRFNNILREVSRDRYPITGAEAVGKHFIPFYNLFWIFRWPTAMSDYLNRRGRVKMVSGYLLGAILLVSALTSRFFDAGIGMTGMFLVGMYISAKLRRHVELIRTPDRLPPLPDPNWYQQAPTGAEGSGRQKYDPAEVRKFNDLS